MRLIGLSANNCLYIYVIFAKIRITSVNKYAVNNNENNDVYGTWSGGPVRG